jgi:hypothetical protein
VQLVEAKQAGEKELALKLLREVTTGYAACTDMPHAMVTPELVELYPDAKVVLVTRDPERWWKSIQVSNVLCATAAECSCLVTDTSDTSH